MSDSSAAISPRYIARDIRAGIVVFFVAIPLCLGIAIASGAPPLSGLIAGMIGGLVVSLCSGSSLAVSGPAAGLTAIVLGVIESHGYGGLLLATVIAGFIQLVLGFLRMGIIGAFVPSGVIKGMLAGIGLILIATQIPLAIGHGADNTASLTAPRQLAAGFSPLAMLITGVCLAILIFFETPLARRRPWLAVIPPPLLAVLVAVGISLYARSVDSALALSAAQHVQLPGLDGPADFLAQLRLPDISHLYSPDIYIAALTIALVASLETLLSIEAVDELDPLGRQSSTHRELKAQGLGNMASGLIGGLPLTAVIVRSSANVQAGGRTRLASFLHGVLLLVSVVFLAFALETIPLAALAAILLFTGYKLARPALIAAQYRAGWQRFIPFVVTVVVILATDLLIGVLAGIAVALYFLIRAHHTAALSLTRSDQQALLRLNSEVSFLSRQDLRDRLAEVPDNGYLIIDASANRFMDPDIREDIQHFVASAPARGIEVELRGFDRHTATYAEVDTRRRTGSRPAMTVG